MCGIVGVVTHRLAKPSISGAAIAAMRDAMAHRGPDDAGLWRQANAALAHRRLAVIDPDPRSNQPFVSPSGRHAIVYNGELYNDDELRKELAALGVTFRTTSDTETVLHAIITWGDDALARFRGMFALAYLNLDDDRLLLARDPLGIKPLVWTRVPTPDGAEIAFASEAHALAHHPAITLRPDLVTVSAYLTTIRITLGERTLFDGVRTLTPGQALAFDLARSDLPVRSWDIPWPAPRTNRPLRSHVIDSIESHLRSDVPICVLLSGGLDSSIIASIAATRLPALHTFASGDAASLDAPDSDFAHARAVAAHVGSIHHEAPVTRAAFARLWPDIIARQGVPLSTPNETAIHTVAMALRRMGMVVALSGEGADELFAGYDQPLEQALAFESTGPRSDADRGLFQLAASSWATLDAKAQILQPELWRALEADSHLRAFYQHEFQRIAAGLDDPMQAHLHFHRRVNLAGLLARLDSATMLASVEGRTPLADAHLAAIAEAMPMSEKFRSATHPTDRKARTKLALREAFAPDLPPATLARPKDSFPLPFQAWMADHAPLLRTTPWLRSIFTDAALATVAHRPADLWSLAWPMTNLAHWARRWGW